VTDLPAGGGAMRHRALLLLLVVTWAVSWPAIKVGVSVVPPLWYACLRYLIAATCLFALLMLRRQLVFPPRSDWPLIAVSGALQMGTYSALTSFALTVLPPGRAAVLAFSTPIWVVPLAAWRLRERVSRVGLLGVGVGMLGVLAIAAPSLHASGTQIASYAMLIGAAAAWAVTIVFVRSHRFTASAFALAPWQMLLATILLTLVAIVVEGPPAPMPARGLASLVYVGPVATAFAYWAVVETGRHFRASTMSMALLATPSVGILISAMTLGETLDPSLIAGAVLIGSGIRMATLAP
jgi:drug/metabolite transporter (DMT)-like permease